MRKALSAENLASFAQSTFGSLRRFIVPNGEEVSELATYTRTIEDRCVRGYAIDSRALVWAQLLEQELAAALCPHGVQSNGNGGNRRESSTGGSSGGAGDTHRDPHALPPVSELLGSGMSTPTESSEYGGCGTHQLPPHRSGIPWGGGGMAAAAARGATPSTPPIGGERVPLNPKRKAPSESALLAALECCRLVYRTYGDDGISVFREARLLPTLLTCLEGAACSKKLVEAVQVFLLDALGGVPSTCLADVSEDLHALISLTSPPSGGGLLGQSASSTSSSNTTTKTTQSLPTTQFLGPKLRTLLLLYATLKRADLACIATSNEVKSGLVQMGMLDSLIRIAMDMRDHYSCAHDASKNTSKSLLGITTPDSSIPASKAFGTSTSNVGGEPPSSLFLAVGMAAIGVIGGLVRSNVPNKQELVDQHPIFFSLWSFYSGHVNRMDSAYSFVPVVEVSDFSPSSSPAVAPSSSVTTPKVGAAAAFSNSTSPNPTQPASPHTTKASHTHRGEEQVVVCDSAPHWAPELAEILIELSTSDSFSLTRQSLIHEVVTESQAAPFHIANSTADGTLDRWEQLPGDWDALVSAGSVVVWRMTSAVSNCSLSASSAKQLLDALRNLDLTSRGTDYVFRTTLACLIIICRASPINMDAIAEADGMRALVSMMVNKKSSVLTFEEDLGGLPRASVTYGRPSWEICRSLLALLMFTNPHSNELRTLMTAIGEMLTQPTCVEDCEIIEFCLHTIGSGTYPKKVLWFTSADAKVVCPVDRFAGRWYGYTFVAWVNPLCIWSCGSQIFAYAESATPSAVVLTIVANGKSKCLAIKSISGSETLMTMLDGATLGEGWSHIAVVHNISGYVVWVNGKRRSAPSTTVPFPKEPSKPHKLTFSFGGGGAQGSGVLPFLGMMTTPQLIDGSIQDKDIERLYQAGAGSTVQSLDPPVPLQPFLEVDSTANTTPFTGPNSKEVPSPNNSVILGSVPKGSSSDQGLDSRLSASDIPPALPPMGDSSIAHRTISPTECVREGSVKSTPSSPSKAHLSPPPQHLVRRCSSYNKAEDDIGGKGRVVGLLAKPREIEVDSVFFAELPNVPDLLVGENVIGWFRTVIGSMDDSSNSHSVAILCIEMLTVYARQVREGVASIYASGVLEDLRAKLLSWEHIPMQVVPILVELGLPSIGVRTLVNHPLSTQLLQLVVDIAAQDKCPASTRSGAFRELSSLLSFSDNLRLFKNGPKLESLLALCSQIPLECTDDFVVLVEKVVKDTPEMTQLFQFLIHEPEGPSSHPSPLLPTAAESFAFPISGGTSTPSHNHNARNGHGRVVPTIKCSVLRMIYDVSKSNPSLIDMLGSVGAVQQLMIICHSATSEVIRVYALRLLALILHASKRQKESFIRANGFETLSYVLSDGATNDVPLGIPTFNCLFKFALDFFQVTTSDVNSSVMSKLRAFQTPSGGKPGTPATAGGGGATATSHKLDGHLPSLIPESNRRTVSMDMSSMYSGDTAGDMESRLSIDDSYSNQTRGGMIHPQLMQTIFQLLNVVLKDIKAAYKSPTPETSSRPAELERQNTIPASDGGGSETPSTTASSRHADDCIVAKVMDYTSKVFDVAVNSEAVVAFPWLDWIWSGVSEVYLHPGQYPRSTFTVVDKGVRSILRKIVLADLYRGKSVTQIKKVKEFADLPQLQQVVLEEVTRYFSASNRLDALKQDVATHVIRNLDTLLLGIDESISPFPLNIGLEVVNAVKSMTVNSNNWVRGRIRNNSRLLETRDRLAFLLLTSLDHLQGERREYLSRIVDANLHDPNSALVLLRLFVDAYDNKSAERVELIQSMLCELVEKDASFSKTILKYAANDADFLQVLKGGSSDELFAWCTTNDAQWKNLAQSILKSSKPIESEVSARHEKREKEVTGRKKLRKVEVEKRLAVQRKASTDFDRVKGELESKQASYESAIAQRRRELLRRGASVGATPPMMLSPTASTAQPTPSSPPPTPGDSRRVRSE